MQTDEKEAAKQKRLLEKYEETDIAEIVAKLEQKEARLKKVTETVCPPPSPRSNFTFCTHPEKEKLILFGGEFFNGKKVCIFNDLYFYNIRKNEWKHVKSPCGPVPRSGHQMIPVAGDGGQLWLFGGKYASPSQVQLYYYNDLWVLRISTKKWEKITAANGPSPRSGHRMVTSMKQLIVFGGFHDNNQSHQSFNDVHIFSLENYSWLKIDVTGTIPPPPRSGCCMAPTTDGKILIWGGYSKSQVKNELNRGIIHSDMYALVPDKSEPRTKLKWIAMKPDGMWPLPRSGIAATVAPNGKAYCFGGVTDIEEDEENLRRQFENDLYSLDLSNPTWRLLATIQKSEIKKKSKTELNANEMEEAQTTVNSDGVFTMTVAVGSSSSDLKKPEGKCKELKSGPSPRIMAALTIRNGMLYLYGGIYEDGNKQHTMNDFYVIDLRKLDEWKKLISNDSDSSESGWDSDDDTVDFDDTECDLFLGMGKVVYTGLRRIFLGISNLFDEDE